MRRTRAGLLAVAVAAALVAVPGAGSSPWAQAQDEGSPSVLVYSRTAGFRHLSIPDGIATIQQLGQANGFDVEATEDPEVFTDESLARFDAVVFLNTTGSVMTDEGRAAFERYVRGGGGYVGVHAAADTEYEWDFYEHILGGAYFLSHPVQQPGVVVTEMDDHPSTAHLPARWLIPLEEFYSFVASPREHVRVLLSIDESTYLQDPNTSHLPTGPDNLLPEGQTGVMGDHPMSWCHDIDQGRVWYSALGHESYLYQLPDYREHLLGGLLTAMGEVEADCRVEAAAPAPIPTEPGPTPTAPGPTEPSRAPAPSPSPAPGGSAPPTASVDDTATLPATGGSNAGPWPLLALGALLLASRVRSRMT